MRHRAEPCNHLIKGPQAAGESCGGDDQGHQQELPVREEEWRGHVSDPQAGGERRPLQRSGLGVRPRLLLRHRRGLRKEQSHRQDLRGRLRMRDRLGLRLDHEQVHRKGQPRELHPGLRLHDQCL